MYKYETEYITLLNILNICKREQETYLHLHFCTVTSALKSFSYIRSHTLISIIYVNH